MWRDIQLRRYLSVLITVSVGLALLIAACNGDDDVSDDTGAVETEPTEEVTAEEPTPEAKSSPEPELTATPEPTTTPAPTPTAEPEPTPESEPAAEMTDEELSEYLLALEDMPTGWTATQMSDDDVEEIDAPDSELICDSEPIDEVLDPVADVEAEFSSSELGPFLIHSLILMPDREQGALAINTIREMFSCSEWTTVDDAGEEMVWHLNPVSFPTFGDDTFASRVTTEVMGFNIEMNLVVVQERSFIAFIMHWGLGSIDSAQTEEFVRRAVEKLPD
jgi:hypothetical protein